VVQLVCQTGLAKDGYGIDRMRDKGFEGMMVRCDRQDFTGTVYPG